MGWFNRKSEPVMPKLSKKVFEETFLCTEALKPDLERKFGKDTEEFNSKYIPVMFEFMYFFLHLTDRYAFGQLGEERRNKLVEELVPTTIAIIIEVYFAKSPKHVKEGIEKELYNNLNNAQLDYASCKELLLMPEDDTKTLDKLLSGAKSKSMVGQLTDNLSQVIEGQITTDPFFPMLISEVVIASLKKKELQILVSEVYR